MHYPNWEGRQGSNHSRPNMPENVQALTAIKNHVRSLYVFDENDRIASCNQFNGGPVPHFHLARSAQGNVWTFHQDVPASVVSNVEDFAHQEPQLEQPLAAPKFAQQYLDLLSTMGDLDAIWQGPIYRFARTALESANHVVEVTQHNVSCLDRYMRDWVEDVGHRTPFMAAMEGDHAVAVCASARMGQEAHEAGVETAPDFRRQGHARAAISAWANAVVRLGAQPLYSTHWDNVASQSTAMSLGLEFVGSDFHIRYR